MAEYHGVKQFNAGRWPPQSPELNPIEHEWPIVGRMLANQAFSNREELWQAVHATFNCIPPHQVLSLYNSLPDRMPTVNFAHGGHTRY